MTITVQFNTKDVQMESLVSFMAELGYEFTGRSFENFHLGKTGLQTISFENAVRLHNTDSSVWLKLDERQQLNAVWVRNPAFSFRVHAIRGAYARKIVRYVKLQRVRDEIKVLDHWVRFDHHTYKFLLKFFDVLEA